MLPAVTYRYTHSSVLKKKVTPRSCDRLCSVYIDNIWRSWSWQIKSITHSIDIKRQILPLFLHLEFRNADWFFEHSLSLDYAYTYNTHTHTTRVQLELTRCRARARCIRQLYGNLRTGEGTREEEMTKVRGLGVFFFFFHRKSTVYICGRRVLCIHATFLLDSTLSVQHEWKWIRGVNPRSRERCSMIVAKTKKTRKADRATSVYNRILYLYRDIFFIYIKEFVITVDCCSYSMSSPNRQTWLLA